MRIFITHCSAKKNESARKSHLKVSPDKLYTGRRIQRFMRRCMERKANWAIFSDRYGVWFPHIKHVWYDRSPGAVTEQEFRRLLDDFDEKLQAYNEIWFYYHPSRFHSLYKRLLRSTELKERVRMFTHISDVT